MERKEVTEKQLEEYNDVFADIINVLLFNGKRVVSEESLIETKVKSQYIEETGRLHEMERNVARYWEEGNIYFVIYRLEKHAEKCIPVRAISYNNFFYRQNHLAEDKEKHIIPVVSLILYYGTTECSSPHNLKIIARVPESLKPCFGAHKANMIPVSFLDDETVQMFQSDFRIIADFLVQKRMKKYYIPDNREIKHVDEVLELLQEITGDDGYHVKFSENEKKSGVTMCNVMDKVERKNNMINEERMDNFKDLRPIDDVFMQALFKDNKVFAQNVLRIILDKTDLQITEMEPGKCMKKLIDSGHVYLNVFAKDSNGKDYDIAFFGEKEDVNFSEYCIKFMDSDSFHRGCEINDLPEAYAISIVKEKTFEKESSKSLPAHTFVWMDVTAGVTIDNGAYRMFVNGMYQIDSDAKDAKGWLMHDFWCVDPDEMHYDWFAKEVKKLKKISD